MTIEGLKEDGRSIDALQIVGRKDISVNVTVRATCNKCGFHKTIKRKHKDGYVVYSDGTNSRKSAVDNATNTGTATLKNELETEHRTKKSCREPLVYK